MKITKRLLASVAAWCLMAQTAQASKSIKIARSKSKLTTVD